MDSACTILIVEDDTEIREPLAAIIERHGFSVLQAGDGVRALEILNDTSPALIILDLRMPRMDGWQFLAETEKHPRLASIPVLITTALHTESPRNLPMIVKPIYPEKLLDTVRRMIA